MRPQNKLLGLIIIVLSLMRPRKNLLLPYGPFLSNIGVIATFKHHLDGHNDDVGTSCFLHNFELVGGRCATRAHKKVSFREARVCAINPNPAPNGRALAACDGHRVAEPQVTLDEAKRHDQLLLGSLA